MSDRLTVQERARRKLLWRAKHRGMKEMDLMLGTYASQHLDHMTADELVEFAEILDTSDAQLSDWLTNKSPTPKSFQTEMFANIKKQSFVPADYKKT
jgi:antitoxin CptB